MRGGIEIGCYLLQFRDNLALSFRPLRPVSSNDMADRTPRVLANGTAPSRTQQHRFAVHFTRPPVPNG